MSAQPNAHPDDAELRFIEQFALVLTSAGMARMPARVYACLLAEDDGQLTAGELAARLQVSPAAISGAVRYLTDAGLIGKGREPGARRDHYRLGDDPWYESFAYRDAPLRRMEDALAEGVELFGTDRPAGRRLRISREFVAFLRGELPAIRERWRSHRDELKGPPGSL